ncbi:hypothetical protein GCM10020331_070820 [Ectobacillus funiculus]
MKKKIEVYRGNEESVFIDFDGENVTEELTKYIDPAVIPSLIDELMLIDEAGNDFSIEKK